MSEEALREDIIQHSEGARYVAPADPLLVQKLSWFQDQKLALFVHFGVYSQMGMCESWPLSDGDAHWARTEYTWEKDPDAFRKSYFDLNRSFNPIRLNPEEWAQAAKEGGCRYFILTSKHHDGFCLYDTKETDYKVTSPDCPFHVHRNANIIPRMFDAFRRAGLGVMAYFSKPDWHCPWYWAPHCEKPIACDRNPTYDPAVRKDLWKQFREFTFAQMKELVTQAGPLDALWLDGGQVRPSNGQDLNMDEIARTLREIQPDLLLVDRTVGGPHENYITPEQEIPSRPVLVPWESCLTVGHSFAFRFCDTYKSPRKLASMLIDVISKGGNLALGVGAQPDGRLPEGAMRSMKGLGDWLKEAGEAVYATRAAAPYQTGAWAGGEGVNLGYTSSNGQLHVLMPLEDGEALPARVLIPWAGSAKAVRWTATGQPLTFHRTEAGLDVSIPPEIASGSPVAGAISVTL